MGSLILRSKGSAAGYSLRRCIAAGIFGFSNSFCGCRMMSSMRSVNSADESPSSSSKISPWLMLPPAFECGDMVYKFYSLAEKKIVTHNKSSGGGGGDGEEESAELPDDDALLVGSSHGWLVLFNQRNCDLFLSDPLSCRHIKLPPIDTLPIPEINLKRGQECVSKVIISCSPDVEEECRAMMSFGPESRLAFCWPGRSKVWTPIGALYHEDEDDREFDRELGGNDARYYEDFVYSSGQKRFFCITKFKDLEGWDLEDPQSPKIDWFDFICWWDDIARTYPWSKESVRQQKYLVFEEQSNQLFVVTRLIMARMGPDGLYVKRIHFGDHRGWDDSYPYKTIGFDVHKIDREGGKKLRYMEGSLDGLAMFIGINHSFAISAAELLELNLNPNCIYFTDDKEHTPPIWVNSIYGGHDIGIFNYENKTFSPCYYPSEVQSFKRIMPAPLWFTPSPN